MSLGMRPFINPSAEVPIYRQIMRQIAEAIAGGRLKPGDKLDSHRDLAQHLVIAPLTVKKAYDELEAQGYIETQRGRGTFVCAKMPRVNREKQREHLRARFRELMSQAYLDGFDYLEIMKMIKDADAEILLGRMKEIS
jgi:GntR family transcriptional regulator